MTIAYLLILHFIADFLLQTRKVAVEKSKDLRYLTIHAQIILCTFALGTIVFFGWGGLGLSAANSVIHALIDWNIWKLYKWGVARSASESDLLNWKYWEDYRFYSTIGFDQLLHGLTLVALASYFL